MGRMGYCFDVHEKGFLRDMTGLPFCKRSGKLDGCGTSTIAMCLCLSCMILSFSTWGENGFGAPHEIRCRKDSTKGIENKKIAVHMHSLLYSGQMCELFACVPTHAQFLRKSSQCSIPQIFYNKWLRVDYS